MSSQALPFSITGTQLKHICPSLTQGRADILAVLHNELMPKYGMVTADQFHEYAGQIAHESNQFAARDENLNYSAERLHAVWPSRFSTVVSAKPFAHNSEKLANYVYANRMGNGDVASGDGYRFRGGGFLMITGRSMYAKYASYIKQDIVIVSGLVRTTDRWALDVSLWYFCIERKLLDEAERDEWIKITKEINGGLIGIEQRTVYYERAKLYVKQK